LDFLSESPPVAPPLACGLGQVADLKRRLKMILSKTTPHSLGRAGAMAVLGLGVMLLPLVAGVSRGDEEEQQPPPRGGTFQGQEKEKVFPRKAEGVDLDKLEADLKQQLEAIARAKQRIEEARRAMAEKEKAAAEKARQAEKGREGGKGGATIHIVISGVEADPKQIEKMVKEIEKIVPGKDSKVMVTRHEHKDGKEHGFQFKFKGPEGGAWSGKATQSKVEVRPPAVTGPALPMTPRPPQFGGDNKRVEELEKKLDAVIRELESMKKELKGDKEKSRKGPPGFGFGSGSAPGPKKERERP